MILLETNVFVNKQRGILTIIESFIYKRIITVYIQFIAFIYCSHRVRKVPKKLPSNSLDC